MQSYIMAFVIGFLMCYFLTPYIKKMAIKIGAIDNPDERKVHKAPIPRMGGLAIYMAFIVAVLCSVHVTREIVGLLAGGTFIVVLGILDDKYQLPAKVKLAGQIFAAMILVFFDIRIEWLTYPSSDGYFYMDGFSIPITILWVVGMTNALNLIDGLDGLAAGVAFIASVTISIVAIQSNFYLVTTLTLALSGSILAFMRYNFNPASIFMGDTGSMFLGYMLAAISVLGVVKSAAAIALFVPTIALGLPIIDTFFAILRRYTNGKPIFKPDKGHLHHRLLATGMSQRQTVLLMYLITIALSFSSLLFLSDNRTIATIVISVLITIIFVGAKKIGILNDI